MSVANVAVMVGNGFDLKAGLDTSARSFVESFVERYGSGRRDPWDTPAARLCQRIREDGIGTWCDFERRIGEYSPSAIEVGDDARASEYVAAKAALDGHLGEYVKAQDERVDDAFVSANAKRCANSLANWLASLTGRDVDAFLQGLSLPVEFYYDVLCFNYTSALESLLSPYLGRLLEPSVAASSGSVKHRLNSFSYVHGTVAGAPVCGVDNPGQIRDVALRGLPEVVDTTVKPSIQAMMGSNQDRDAVARLANADVVLVFGMSLGVTDQRWWRIVCDSLKKSSSRRVVVCVRGLEEKTHVPASYFAAKRGWRSRLIEAAGLDVADYPAEARERILLVDSEPVLQVDQPAGI